ncbi:hypothetical protein [Streptomyces sp. G7(2002)]|uniref:hypothetical protein n=1 Tax=Streptomyces sp. G7(2002) TaxID=2971798 RepID=UPI00237DB80D|nr:hypothetical protein [Streptomyces sp. G7(2002)]WDT54091.1 hypothetical protein NUT86_08515 [Streptomyces sp. G7(2002)]
MTDTNTAAQTEPDEPGKPPLRQRITARWDNLQPATKAVVVTALTAAATGALRALVDSRTPAAAPTPQSEVAGETQTGRYDHLGRHVYLHNHGHYYVCRHTPCSKKADWTIPGHDCCGRCTPGRTCRREAQRDYAGPGSFAHKFWDTLMHPGVCATCGEPPEVHPEP